MTSFVIIQQAGGAPNKTKHGRQRAVFGAAAARIWNDLPPTIINVSSISAFKKHLKSFLFN